MNWRGRCITLIEDMRKAIVGNVSSNGITLKIPPSTEASEKRYKRLLTGSSLAANDEVLVVKVDGTYIILDKIGYS